MLPMLPMLPMLSLLVLLLLIALTGSGALAGKLTDTTAGLSRQGNAASAPAGSTAPNQSTNATKADLNGKTGLNLAANHFTIPSKSTPSVAPSLPDPKGPSKPAAQDGYIYFSDPLGANTGPCANPIDPNAGPVPINGC